MLIAQLPSATANGMTEWLICAAAALVIVERALAFYKNHMRESPVPGETYTKQADCVYRHQELTGRLRELEHKREQDVLSSGESRKLIYKKLDDTRDNIDDLRRELSEKIDELRKDISNGTNGIEARVIATLKNTGAI